MVRSRKKTTPAAACARKGKRQRFYARNTVKTMLERRQAGAATGFPEFMWGAAPEVAIPRVHPFSGAADSLMHAARGRPARRRIRHGHRRRDPPGKTAACEIHRNPAAALARWHGLGLRGLADRRCRPHWAG